MKQSMRCFFIVLVAMYASFIMCDSKESQIERENMQEVPVQDQDMVKDDLFLIDSIGAVVYGQERTDVVTLSDIKRPSLDGNQQSLEDMVITKLIAQDAARYKMEPDEDAVDSRLEAVQRENNLTRDDLKSIFSNAGYSFEEGREQFKIMTAVGSMVDFRIRSRLIVPEKDIQAYYKEHPKMQEASFQVERAVVTCPSGMDNVSFMQELKQLVESGRSNIEIDWCEPFWINKSEIAQDKKFLTTMEIGDVAMGNESAAGIELFKLINKKEEHLESLEERYNEIAEYLKRPKYNELFEQYKKDLFANSVVVYF